MNNSPLKRFHTIGGLYRLHSLDEQSKLAARVLDSYWNISRVTVKMEQQNAASLGLSLQQMSILNTLHATPEMKLKELTERLVSSKSTLSVNIDGLVKAGLVVREIPMHNRREVKLRLTDRGKDISKQSIVKSTSSQAILNVLNHLTAEEIDQLLRINEGVLQALCQSTTDSSD